jgi:hypothetical protein
MAHTCQQERPESAPHRIGFLEVVLFEQEGEEFLRQIARIVLTIAAPANEDIYGIPIQLAQLHQRCLG